MYTSSRREHNNKPPRDDHHKPSRKTQHQNMPSFSSTLLDEIYRSIDGTTTTEKDNKTTVKKQTSFRHKAGNNNSAAVVEDEELASLRRVKTWIEKEALEKEKIIKKEQTTSSSLFVHHHQHQVDINDALFFSSSSTSSSDSSGQLSSSDTEFFGPCVPKPKPIRTGSLNRKQQEDSYLFDDYKNHEKENKKINREDQEFIKSKSRALKIYANLKKMKHPISPGGKLTTFINSLFTANAEKQTKKNADASLPSRKAATTTCSSATSFSRSCLSKCSPGSTEAAMQRTVRFHPVDEDSRRKCVVEEDVERHGRPPLPPNAVAEMKQSLRQQNRKIEEAAHKVLQGYNRKNKDEFSIFRKIHRDEDFDDDAMSDSSSDLFELDHLATFSNNRYCEELPVYETTLFSTNRGVTTRMVR